MTAAKTKKRHTADCVKSRGTHLADTMGLINDKTGQKSSLVQVVQGRDQLVTRTHLGDTKRQSATANCIQSEQENSLTVSYIECDLSTSHLFRSDIEQFNDGIFPGELHIDPPCFTVTSITRKACCWNLK